MVLESVDDKFLCTSLFCRAVLRELVVVIVVGEEWAVRDLNPRPFDYQSNAPPS